MVTSGQRVWNWIQQNAGSIRWQPDDFRNPDTVISKVVDAIPSDKQPKIKNFLENPNAVTSGIGDILSVANNIEQATTEDDLKSVNPDIFDAPQPVEQGLKEIFEDKMQTLIPEAKEDIRDVVEDIIEQPTQDARDIVKIRKEQALTEVTDIFDKLQRGEELGVLEKTKLQKQYLGTFDLDKNERNKIVDIAKRLKAGGKVDWKGEL